MLSTLFLLTSLFLSPLLVLFPNMMPLHLRRRGGFPRLPRPPPNEASSSSGNSSTNSNPNSSEPQPYEPSALDVVVAKLMLQQGLHLPPEVVLSILDFAEYWPHTTAVLNRSLNATAGRPSENLFILRSKPLGLIKKVHYNDNLYNYTPAPAKAPSSADDFEYPLDQFQDWINSPIKAVQHPCRKIVFTITSHDQGWGGDRPTFRGTFNGSYTWFEAGLERFDRNAERPEGTDERDPNPPASKGKEKQAGEEEIPGNDAEQQQPESGESPTSSSSSFVVVNNDQQDQNQDQPPPSDLPSPYLPVYTLRPIQPSLHPDRPDILHHTLNPNPDWMIQCNKTATREWTTHRVVWSWTDDLPSNAKTAEQLRLEGRGQGTGTGAFVRDLKLGDVVTVWAKARFGGWTNHVQDVRMDVYWAL